MRRWIAVAVAACVAAGCGGKRPPTGLSAGARVEFTHDDPSPTFIGPPAPTPGGAVWQAATEIRAAQAAITDVRQAVGSAGATVASTSPAPSGPTPAGPAALPATPADEVVPARRLVVTRQVQAGWLLVNPGGEAAHQNGCRFVSPGAVAYPPDRALEVAGQHRLCKTCGRAGWTPDGGGR